MTDEPDTPGRGHGEEYRRETARVEEIPDGLQKAETCLEGVQDIRVANDTSELVTVQLQSDHLHTTVMLGPETARELAASIGDCLHRMEAEGRL